MPPAPKSMKDVVVTYEDYLRWVYFNEGDDVVPMTESEWAHESTEPPAAPPTEKDVPF